MTKVDDWKSRKARKQDLGRRSSCCPVGRTALPEVEPEQVPPLVAWFGRLFVLFWIIVIVGLIVAIRSML